jgi:5-methylcytosine-specific restriction endonuclease McrA
VSLIGSLPGVGGELADVNGHASRRTLAPVPESPPATPRSTPLGDRHYVCSDCRGAFTARRRGALPKRCLPCKASARCSMADCSNRLWAGDLCDTHARRAGIKKKRVDRPNASCSRCGRPAWRGRSSLPLIVCRPCRREAFPLTGGQRGPRAPMRSVVCECGTTFSTRHRSQRWCTTACRLTHADRAKNRRRSTDQFRRTGRPYQRLREQVLSEEQRCWICKGPFFGSWPMPLAATLDHIIPLSKGGSVLDRSNCRAAHLRCNAARGDRTVDQAGREFYFAGVGWVSVEV